MSEHEDDGSALTFPPLLEPPPPPPQPAARSASAAVIAISAASENFLFTLPPWSLTPPMPGSPRLAAAGWPSIGLRPEDCKKVRAAAGLQCCPGRSGGTGRRAGLKIRFPSGSVGSSPTFGTDGRSADRLGVS